MKNIKISESLRLACIEKIENDYSKHKRLENHPLDAQFDLLTLKDGDELNERIREEFKSNYDIELTEARLHRWYKDDYASEHIDNYLINNDTVIIRLDDIDKTKRLKINESLVDESAGSGYWFDEGTSHEILSGDDLRYTITAWVKNDKNTKGHLVLLDMMGIDYSNIEDDPNDDDSNGEALLKIAGIKNEI